MAKPACFISFVLFLSNHHHRVAFIEKKKKKKHSEASHFCLFVIIYA